MILDRVALIVFTAAASSCGGSSVAEPQDASAETLEDTSVEGGVDAADVASDVPLPDTPTCPTEAPRDSSPCPAVGLTCVKKCTSTDDRAWTAVCRLSLDRLGWSVWGNPCSDTW